MGEKVWRLPGGEPVVDVRGKRYPTLAGDRVGPGGIFLRDG
ncbi:hypothetical protein [Verrucomicrobium spinosum]|nr:hypothetical protein [Verrucomicrobium spinosum]